MFMMKSCRVVLLKSTNLLNHGLLQMPEKIGFVWQRNKVLSHLNSAINLRKSKKPNPKLNENQILLVLRR